MVRLAQFRGWDEEPLHQWRQFCLDREVVAQFESPRRQSPNRQHKATLTLYIDPTGLRHITITARDRAGNIVATKEEIFRAFYCDFYSWRTMSSRFRWTSDTSLTSEDIVGKKLSLPPPT